FAKAPVAKRRFALPEPLVKYNDKGDVHNATYYRARCWQTGYEGAMDEDCLYLNVMTPNISKSYPVLVFIPGGSFTTGGADIYHWKGAIRNLVSRGIVVVTIQYRLGLLGFFTTFTERFPPNRGMYDQIQALRWVKEEIDNFGGDSNRITIYGESAGASSVSDLSFSPLARGLFHQIIQSSGSAIQQLESMNPPMGSVHKDRAMQICNIDSNNWGSAVKDKELFDCLQKTAPQRLTEFDFSDVKNWNVVIDGAFLPDHPEKLAETRSKYPALMGDMLEEFAIFTPAVITGDISIMNQNSNLEFVKNSWNYFDDDTAKNFSDTMIDGYSDGIIPEDDDHMGW
ncbi:hypothetical protein PMAYCL1PPCAC_08597, partial [Pristionchus mayeri]